jgi:hypothetical protein
MQKNFKSFFTTKVTATVLLYFLKAASGFYNKCNYVLRNELHLSTFSFFLRIFTVNSLVCVFRLVCFGIYFP